MNFTIVTVAAIATATLPAVAAADYSGEYLCQDQFAAGMVFANATHQWQSSTFKPPGIKFILRLYGTPLPRQLDGRYVLLGRDFEP